MNRVKYLQSKILFLFALILVITTSCNNIKYLPKGEELYTGADLKLKSEDKIYKKGALQDELESLLSPKPNKTLFGLRPKLWMYNKASEVKNKKLKAWLTKKGEKPVLFSSVNIKNTKDLLTNKLNNSGYFHPDIDTNTVRKGRKVKLTYIVKPGNPYRIDQIVFPDSNDVLTQALYSIKQLSGLKQGDIYNLDSLKSERIRIDGALKNAGFYYFNPDFLLFKVDSTIGGRKLNLYLTIKDETPDKARLLYKINEVFVYPNYSLDKDSSSSKPGIREISGYNYVDSDSAFYPPILLRSIFIKKDDSYMRENHSLTLKRLSNLGTFKFVNVRFAESDTSKPGKLNGFIYLTPMPKRSIRLELQALSKSNNFVGPALIASYRNRNFMRRASLLVFNLNGGYETQISGGRSGFNSYEFGGDIRLTSPRFVVPFKLKKEPRYFVPKTKTNLGFRFLNRVLYYSMSSFNFNYGFTWNESNNKEHEFIPISFNYVLLNSTTPEFDALLNQNKLLKKSFERQFILGSIYSYTYNSPEKEDAKNKFYFRGNVDVSGNTLHLVQTLLKEKKEGEGSSSFLLFNVPYSQYSKLDVDLRYTLTLGKKHKLASRFIGGMGLPYGNSETMPYIKQFFSGGPNSIRAFRTRSLGPGSFATPDSVVTGAFLDQAGDIKLEGNVEYRFDIYKLVKGALFADAGNIWLTHDNPGVPGGKFDSKKFIKEMAVGTGMGVRFDISFLVLRFDLGIPLRKPYLPEEERWVFNKIRFGNSAWRRDNLILNIAIGYPF